MRSLAVDRLSPDELDLLGRIVEKHELRPFFFRKAKGLKWFDPLVKNKFFSPENNLPPRPAKEEGYVTIPFWPATEYLVSTSTELRAERAKEYAKQFLEILRTTTAHARAGAFSNYRTWYQFAKIIQNIPLSLIEESDIEMVAYWIGDPYDRSLVATEIGTKWLPVILDHNDAHNRRLALGLIDKLFEVENHSSKTPGESKVVLRLPDWHAEKLVDSVAEKAGQKIGLDAANIFQKKMESLLVDEDNDKWSSVWRRAIEDHEQDKYRNDAGHVLISAFRDSLLGSIGQDPEASRVYVGSLLKSRYETTKRIAIYVINQRFDILNVLVDRIIDMAWFTSNFRHELWHLFNKRFGGFSSEQRASVLSIVGAHVENDETGHVLKGATAYWQAIWLAAIKDYGETIAQHYSDAISLAGGAPEHPDFSSYMTSGFVKHESPYPLEELLALTTEDLIKRLKEFKDPGGFSKPNIEGLAKTVRQLVKSEPLRYCKDIEQFLNCDLAYVYEVIEGFHELWSQKAALPWDEIWTALLRFSRQLIERPKFWNSVNSKERHSFVANRNWIVGAIARLLEDGVKSDEHAFEGEFLPEAEGVLVSLLENQEGGDFKDDGDAVSVAINSPRGHAVGALINLTLRSCRLADKSTGSHAEVWKHFEAHYNKEFERINEFEFATLAANYLPNFLYMSQEWTILNLDKIFDVSDEPRWRCAMQGYAHVNMIYREVYEHLRKHGHLIRALNDKKIGNRVREKVVQNIAVAFFETFDVLTDKTSPISQLLVRSIESELSHLIWFVWTLRDTENTSTQEKVFELWPALVSNIDTRTSSGRKLASRLCTWIAFVKEVTDDQKKLLLNVARYADEGHNAFELLEGIARISEKQPGVAFEIWSKVLEGSRPDYPEEAIRQALRNIAGESALGKRNAKAIVDAYIREGNELPHKILSEILHEHLSA
jgi:hypothetical protein